MSDTPGRDTDGPSESVGTFDADDELRALLRAADPAASLTPADPSRVTRLLEDTMNHVIDQLDVDRQADGDASGGPGVGPRRTGTHGRSPLTWLVAAAAVVVIAGVGAFGLTNRGGDELPIAGDGPTTGTSAGPDDPVVVAAVAELTAPAAAATTGRCAVPSAALVATQSVAFQGTVTAITDGVVTLSPSSVFAGKVAPSVDVTATAADLRALIGAAKFEVGGSYLVSATDGRVSVCGLSGPATPRLQQLYSEAFGG